MSYKNFVPTVWEEAIEHDLERAHVFVTDTNRKYEGKVANLGDTVRILGTGKPTITTQIGGEIKLEDAEKVEGSSISMPIDHVTYFNYMVGDIDKLQAVDGVMDALSTEATRGIADEQDLGVSALSSAKEAVLYKAGGVQITKANVLDTIDSALEVLYGNDVKPDSNITMTVDPWFYMLLKQAYTALDTDNSKMLENGKVGRYGNVIVRMSNNVSKDASGNSLIQVKTDQAIAYACPKVHTEPYRPEHYFSDAVKGFALWGTRIVRPKELVVLNCHA